MSFNTGKLLITVLWFCYFTCNNQCRGITTREAKGFYEVRPSPYLVANDFAPLYIKKDNYKEEKPGHEKQTEMENNQISWINPTVTSTEVSPDKKFWLTEFGETDKIITVRVSSSVERSAWKSNFAEKPKLAALQRIGFDVDVPEMTTRGYDVPYRTYTATPFWTQKTTEAPPANESEGRYYETRIEAVSSRRQVVYGKSRAVTSTTPQYDYHSEPQEEFCEMPEANYELPEKNYEVDEAVSLMTNGNGDRTSEDNGKLGYVMEGRDFRKYRVEERTPDGFIVGEYGFIRHEDGKLHGVRYTADVNANPRLIYDALVKFLSL